SRSCSLPLPSSCTTTRACASHACDPSSRPGQSRPRAPTYRFSRRLTAGPSTRQRWNRRWATDARLGTLTTLRGRPTQRLEHLDDARLASKPPKSHAFPRSQTLRPPYTSHTTSVSTGDNRLDGGTRTALTRRSNRPGSLVAVRRPRRPLGASDPKRRDPATTGTTRPPSPLVTAPRPPRPPPSPSPLESPASPPSPPSSPRSPAPEQVSKTQSGYTLERRASTCLNSSFPGCRLSFRTARPSLTSTTSPHLSRPLPRATRLSQHPTRLHSSLPSQHLSQTSPPSFPPADFLPPPPLSHPAQPAPPSTQSSPLSRSPP
ncbi:hypothetical protein AAT19DRAFT_10177, partial [Rhodotorula toruloides]